jgi:CRISPR/Cas system endoribonuclease Cas6 (RAMP superfamily)
MKTTNDFLNDVIDKITPAILKKYEGSKFYNNPVLDSVALGELKRKYLILLSEGRKDEAEILYNLIRSKPKFAISDETFTTLWLSPIYASIIQEKQEIRTKAKDKFPDILLFTSPAAKKLFMERYNEVVQRTLKDKNKSDTMS